MEMKTNIIIMCFYRLSTHEYLNYFINHNMMFSVLTLAVCGNLIVPCNVNASATIPSDKIDCKTYNTCSQCTNATDCEWLLEKQSCIDSDQKFTSESNKISCPTFKVIVGDYNSKNVNITVVSEVVDNLKTFLDEHKVKCQVGEELKDVTFVNNTAISCNYSMPYMFMRSCHSERENRPNPLFIGYFSIIFDDNVRVKFDQVRDHYFAVYPCGTTNDGTNCLVRSNCTSTSWDDGRDQYYCAWCLKNENCMETSQEGKCYVRDTVTEKSAAVGDVVRVKGDDVRIEDFSPSEGPLTGGTALRVKIRGHRVLGSVHNATTVTVAGLECRDPKTLTDGETIACTVVANGAAVVDGPVVVTYRSAGQPAIELSSAPFNFAVPHADGRECDQEPSVEPGQSFAGIASGGTRVSVRGSFGCARDPCLYVWFEGVRKYGDACSLAVTGETAAAALVCRAPQLPGSATAAAYDVGLRWTYRGRTVHANVSGGLYAPRPDPVFADFLVDGGGHDGLPATVTVRGPNVGGVRRDDVRARLFSGTADGGDEWGDECVLRWVGRTSFTCAVAWTPGRGNRSAADANELLVVVGATFTRWVYPAATAASDPGRSGDGSWTGVLVQCAPFVCVISAASTLLVALSLCALYAPRPKTVTAEQRSDRRYETELRDTATRLDLERFY